MKLSMTSKYFLITGNNFKNCKNFSILLSKQFTGVKNNSLIINFNSDLSYFFKNKNTIKDFKPQKISLKEFYLNVDESLFLKDQKNEDFIISKILEFSNKYSVIIFIINKSNHWIYQFINSLQDLVKLECTKIINIENSIEIDVLNKTVIPFFLIPIKEIQFSKNIYLNLKKIYLNKIIPLNFEFKEDVENVLLIPKRFYNINSLKLIKSILNDI